MSVPREVPPRARKRDADLVAASLGPRDWLVVDTVAQLRLATGRQLDALCFSELKGRSQTVVRGRVIHRLIRWRVLRGLERHVGGAVGGSAELVVGLDTVGVALANERQLASGLPARRYGPPGERFVRHLLAVTQLRADLARAVAGGPAYVEGYTTEPECWWPDGLGGQLKPDAYVALTLPPTRDHWWVEVDRATETLPTLERKLRRYVDFARRGQLGPSGVVPSVLVSTLNDHRLDAIRALCSQLPEPAAQQILTVRDTEAALAMLGRLRE
jgi:hypothetical protein